MDYIVASTAVTDEIWFADGSRIDKAAGGAGSYALCGMKLWCDDVLLCTGVGEDFRELYGAWFQENGLSMEGLLVKNPLTPHTVIRYFADGERVETPKYGTAHYQSMEIAPKELQPYFKTAKGIYIFKNSSPDFWEEILSFKKQSKAVVLWEIANDATCRENCNAVRGIAENVDVFSINMAESRALLGIESKEEIIREYRSWGIPLIFLRSGEEGAVMITPVSVDYVPSQPNVAVVDSTGGGNSSSGAVLYGYTKGFSPFLCGAMGSISAAMCIAQYGVPARIDEKRRKEAQLMLASFEADKC